MMEYATVAKPKIKFKTYRYTTNIYWQGDRAGILASGEKPEFRVASPPEFHGEEGVWTPEDLFVAAVNACTMTTFAAFAERVQLPVFSYCSTAQGILEVVDGTYRFTKIILQPHIVLNSADLVEEAKKTLDDAHQKCLISNSINAEVVVEPIIEVQPQKVVSF
jgi:peroxiredoxin-like protein